MNNDKKIGREISERWASEGWKEAGKEPGSGSRAMRRVRREAEGRRKKEKGT